MARLPLRPWLYILLFLFCFPVLPFLLPRALGDQRFDIAYVCCAVLQMAWQYQVTAFASSLLDNEKGRRRVSIARYCLAVVVVVIIYSAIYWTYVQPLVAGTWWEWALGTDNSPAAFVGVAAIIGLFWLPARAVLDAEKKAGLKLRSTFLTLVMLGYGPLTAPFFYRRLVALRDVASGRL